MISFRASTFRRDTIARNSGIAAVLLAAAFLSACQTSGRTGILNNAASDTPVGSSVNIDSLTDVVNSNPADPSGYNVRGIAYAEAGRTRDALNDFGRAIELDPLFFQAYANRGLVLRNAGRLDEALADYNSALSVNPAYAAAYSGRGTVYVALGRADLALVDFDRAISLDAADARSYYNRGLIYQSQGQQELAIADFTRAISFQSRAPEPYFSRGEVYLARANFDAAYEDFFQTISLGINTAIAWTNLGLALEGQEDYETALTAYRNALVIDPNFAAAVAGEARVAALVPLITTVGL